MRDIQNLPDDGHLYAAHVINDLWRETKGEAIVVTDVGQHQMWEAQYYHHERSRTLITSGGLAPWASPCPPPSAPSSRGPMPKSGSSSGDGGFQMTMAELATIVQEKLNINIAIINNGFLGWCASGRSSSTRALRVHAAVQPGLHQAGRAYGIPASRSRSARRRGARHPDCARTQGRRSSISASSRKTPSIPMVPAGADCTT